MGCQPIRSRKTQVKLPDNEIREVHVNEEPISSVYKLVWLGMNHKGIRFQKATSQTVFCNFVWNERTRRWGKTRERRLCYETPKPEKVNKKMACHKRTDGDTTKAVACHYWRCIYRIQSHRIRLKIAAKPVITPVSAFKNKTAQHSRRQWTLDSFFC